MISISNPNYSLFLFILTAVQGLLEMMSLVLIWVQQLFWVQQFKASNNVIVLQLIHVYPLGRKGKSLLL
jgi:hypothetical protein